MNEVTDHVTNSNPNVTVAYYLSMADANAATNPIAPSPHNNFTASTVYARVENSYGCYGVSTVSLEVSTTRFDDNFRVTLSSCDDDTAQDGLYTFNLEEASATFLAQFPANQNLSVHYYRTFEDAQLEANELPTTYTTEEPNFQNVYVRVESETNGDCFGLGPHLVLEVFPIPAFEVDESFILCEGDTAVLATYNAQDTYTYSWTDTNGNVLGTDSNLTISQAGTYYVTATSANNCVSQPKSIEVSPSNAPTVTPSDIEVTNNNDDNTIFIDDTHLGLGNYEYALDSEFGPYQPEPLFTQVAPGMHTLFIRDQNGCGATSIAVGVVGYDKFFSPNNDGIRDTWHIVGVTVDYYQDANVYIFDRYGKLLKQFVAYREGWNGTFNNSNLPEDDYWFKLQLKDISGNISFRSGHFTLKR